MIEGGAVAHTPVLRVGMLCNDEQGQVNNDRNSHLYLNQKML
jgi:hypothetical protein